MDLEEQHSHVDNDQVHDLVDHIDAGEDDDNGVAHENVNDRKSDCQGKEHGEHLPNDRDLKSTNAFNDDLHLMNNIHNEFYKKITIPSTVDDDEDVDDGGGSGKPMRSDEQEVTNITLNASERRLVNGIGGYCPSKQYNYLENREEDDGDNDADDDDDDERNNNGVHYGHSNHRYAKQETSVIGDEDDDNGSSESRDAAVAYPPQISFAVDTKDEWCRHQLIATNKKHHRIVKTKPLLIIKKYQQIKMDETMNDSSLETDV